MKFHPGPSRRSQFNAGKIHVFVRLTFFSANVNRQCTLPANFHTRFPDGLHFSLALHAYRFANLQLSQTIINMAAAVGNTASDESRRS